MLLKWISLKFPRRYFVRISFKNEFAKKPGNFSGGC